MPPQSMHSGPDPRTVKLFCMVAAAVALAACKPEPDPADTGTIVVALEGAPGTLDPRFAVDAYSTRILDTVMRKLIAIDSSGAPTADIATEWQWSDPLTLRLKIGAATFHDNTRITANVVKSTLDTLRSPELGSPVGAALADIQTITVDGEWVELKLARPSAPLLVGLSIPIIHPDQLQMERIDVPIGSGPFKISGTPERDQIKLIRAAQYCNCADGTIWNIHFRTIADPVARTFSLETGDAHLAQNSIPAGNLKDLHKVGSIAIDRQPGFNVSYLGFRLDQGPTSVQALRQAIALAIDRPAILDGILDNLAKPAATLLPPANWAWLEMDIPARNLDQARSLLDQAGFTDPDGDGPEPRLRLEFKTSTNPERIRIAQAIAGQLGEIGIDLSIRSLEFGTFFEDIRQGNFQMYGLTWVGVIEPDLLHYALHSASIPPSGANRGRNQDPVLDQLLLAARETVDPKSRKELYHQAQRRIAEQLPVIPLWVHDTVLVRDARLDGFVAHPGGSYRSLEDAQILPAAAADQR